MLSKYDIAKEAADAIDDQIIETLKSGKSFRVEAGAGSGKTYSLNKVVDWLQDNYWQSLKKKRQKIACITYTNTGVNVIASRLREDSFIKPMTIHSFAWELVKQYEQELRKQILEFDLLPEGMGEEDFETVRYNIGARYIEDRILYLHHNDVIVLFEKFLNKQKFRKLLTLQYPIILIDEYQDSLKVIIDQFVKWFINKNQGPQFGLFGDSWQTIYDKSSCGEVKSSELIIIGKKSNFRSQKVIVDALNKIRPELPQITAKEENDGFIKVITCNDFAGERQSGYYKGELPNNVLVERIENVQGVLEHKYEWKDSESFITLMITHKMLAKQQNYSTLLELLDDRLKDGDDPYLQFFQKTVEPLYMALESKQLMRLYDALGSDNYPIKYKRQKQIWKNFLERLREARTKTVADVMEVVCSQSEIKIPIMPKIQENHKKYLEDQNSKYEKGTIGAYYDICYSEVLNALAFLNPETGYSTDHGVKGEEYDNVLFVIGRGWNNYQFDKYMGLDWAALTEKDKEAYVRNRNLFYVCCSRAIKKLVLFITIPVEGTFQKYLENTFGVETICTYKDFINEM
ncbi:MAG: ATP-dependent helicase [Clostridiales bacterium]|nr:ATP-dependent helicase [Clostridiales bacterium]